MDKVKEVLYFEVTDGYIGGGRDGKFYSKELLEEQLSGDVIQRNLDTSVETPQNETVGNVQNYNGDSKYNHVTNTKSGYSNPYCDNTHQYHLPNGFGQSFSFLTQADCRDIEKQIVCETVKSDFGRADRRDKAFIDLNVHEVKKRTDLEIADTKENLPHKISDKDGFLYYCSDITKKSFRISGCRYINAELLVSNHPNGKRIIHIWGEHQGRKDFYISEELFYSDNKLLEKLAVAGIHIKYTRRNRVELLNELRIYIAEKYFAHVREIPHHAYWNYALDGSVWYVEPDSESEESVIDSSKNVISDIVSPWEILGTNPFEYPKELLLISLNRVAYILTKFISRPKKSIVLFVSDGQKQYAASLFIGARLISEGMSDKEIGNVLTSTYSGFVIYLYKSNSKTSRGRLKLISEIVEDGEWNGRAITTIPLIITESSIPDDFENYFTIVDNSQLVNVKINDMVLETDSMNQLLKEFPNICNRNDLSMEARYFLFAGLYAVRVLKSEHLSQSDIEKLVDELVEFNENHSEVMSCSCDFIEALYEYVTDESVSIYNKNEVPSAFDLEKDILFDDTYVCLGSRCFATIVTNYSSDIGINSLKECLRDENIIDPSGGSTYTAKVFYYIDGSKRSKTMIKIRRELLRDSFRRPDIIDYKKIYLGRGKNEED